MYDLRWLLNDSDLALEELGKIAQKAKDYEERGLSEWSTAAIFVEPILRGLGWETLDDDDVWRESRGRIQFADFALLSDKKILALIEIKSLWPDFKFDKEKDELVSLTKPKNRHWVGQLLAYGNKFLVGQIPKGFTARPCRRNGGVFLRGILTNGVHWLVYDLAQAYKLARRYKEAIHELHGRVQPIGETHLFGDLQSALTILNKTLSRDELLRQAQCS
jgi:hypothetical protein